MLARDDIHGVSICTPTSSHAPIAIAAMNAGKHVLCEKPMATSLAEAELMAEASKSNERVLLIDHRYLYDPLVKTLCHYQESIGEIFWARTRSAHFGMGMADHIGKTGALIDIGYHPLYTVMFFNGPVTKANAWRRCFLRPDMKDDNGLMVLEHEHGMSIVEGSFSSHGPFGSTRPIELFGSKGVLLANWIPRPTVTLTIGDEMKEVEIVDGPPWNVAMTRHFCECIRGDAQPLSGPDAGLEVMKVLEEVERSANSA
jgi:predicted dehydrogenase